MGIHTYGLTALPTSTQPLHPRQFRRVSLLLRVAHAAAPTDNTGRPLLCDSALTEKKILLYHISRKMIIYTTNTPFLSLRPNIRLTPLIFSLPSLSSWEEIDGRIAHRTHALPFSLYDLPLTYSPSLSPAALPPPPPYGPPRRRATSVSLFPAYAGGGSPDPRGGGRSGLDGPLRPRLVRPDLIRPVPAAQSGQVVWEISDSGGVDPGERSCLARSPHKSCDFVAARLRVTGIFPGFPAADPR